MKGNPPPLNLGVYTCSKYLQKFYGKNWKITEKPTMVSFRCTNDSLRNNSGHDIKSISYLNYYAYTYGSETIFYLF